MTLQQEGPNLWNKHSKIGWSQVGCCTIMDDNPLCNIISKNLCLRDKISPVTLVKSKWLASHGFSPFPTTNILMSGIIPVSCLCLLSSLWLTKGCHMLQGCVGGLVKGVELGEVVWLYCISWDSIQIGSNFVEVLQVTNSKSFEYFGHLKRVSLSTTIESGIGWGGWSSHRLELQKRHDQT